MDAYENQGIDNAVEEGNADNAICNENLDETMSTISSDESFNMDALIDEIKQTDDLDVLDEIYQKLQVQKDTQMLKNIQTKNSEMKSELNSKKYMISELEQLEQDEQKRTENLKEIIEAKRMELQQLHDQQVDDLLQFENDVMKIADIFINAPEEKEHNKLMASVQNLRKELEEKVSELSKYKEELQVAEEKFKQNIGDESYMETSVRTFEESIDDISELNKKLTESVTEMTNKVNTLRSEINSFTLQNN